MSEFRARRSNYKLIKYTNGWDVYSFKPSSHQVWRIKRRCHVRLRLDEYCFCRFRKNIFDSYSKTRKNTQSWIDNAFVLIPLCFGFVRNHVVVIFASLVFVFVHTLNKSDTSLNLEKQTSLKCKNESWTLHKENNALIFCY